MEILQSNTKPSTRHALVSFFRQSLEYYNKTIFHEIIDKLNRFQSHNLFDVWLYIFSIKSVLY